MARETGVGEQTLRFKLSQAIEDRAVGTVNNIHFHQGANHSVHLSTRVARAGCGVGEHVLLLWVQEDISKRHFANVRVCWASSQKKRGRS